MKVKVFFLKTKFLLVVDAVLAMLFLLAIFYIFGFPSGIVKTERNEKIQAIAKQIVNKCFNTNKEKCYEKEFVQLAESKDLFYSESVLYELQRIDPIIRNCHVLAHRISEAATRKDPASWRKLIERVNVFTCGSGFLHGILIAHTSSEPNFRITPSVINDICSIGPQEKRNMCAHMFAHLYLIENDGKIDPSLAICKKIRKELEFECYIGIFMEDHQKNIMVDHGLIKAPIMNVAYANSLKEACSSYDSLTASACWEEMGEIFAKTYDYDQKKVYENCYAAPEEEDRKHCYLKGAVILSIYPSYNTAEKLSGICEPYSSLNSEYEVCVHFIISALMNYSSHFVDRGIMVCSSIKESFREPCFKDLGDQLKINVQSLSDRERLCKDTQDSYKKLCSGEK